MGRLESTDRKRRVRAGFVGVLIFLMVMAAGTVSVSAAALSTTRILVNAGKTAKLTLEGTKKQVKWSVSGRKLASVKAAKTDSRKAVVSAGDKTGSCYVVAKAGGKVYRCRLVVVPKSLKIRKISKSAKNRTGQYAAQKTTSRKADSAFTKAFANTSVRLLNETMKQDPDAENVLVSPDSVFTAVSMVEQGAKGTTRREMQKALGGISAKRYSQYLATLHKRITKSDAVNYQIFNSLWYKDGELTMKKSYLQKIVNYYDAEVYAAPFTKRTVKDINNWVYNCTNGKIPSIIPRLEEDSRLAAVNAVYFKGAWVDPYTSTHKRTFTKEDGTKKKVKMLESTEHTYVTVNGAEGFVKYYQGGQLAFMALLPEEGTTVSSYLEDLTGTDLVKAYKNRVNTNILVHTRMPEFSYDYSVSLEKPLVAMGIKTAFTDDADFSGMSKEPIEIDAVYHKTHIEVNKKGTEAAAATALVMKAASTAHLEPPEQKYVYLNRPFVYAIIDTQTGAPLFIGTLGSVS